MYIYSTLHSTLRPKMEYTEGDAIIALDDTEAETFTSGKYKGCYRYTCLANDVLWVDVEITDDSRMDALLRELAIVASGGKMLVLKQHDFTPAALYIIEPGKFVVATV